MASVTLVTRVWVEQLRARLCGADLRLPPGVLLMLEGRYKGWGVCSPHLRWVNTGAGGVWLTPKVGEKELGGERGQKSSGAVLTTARGSGQWASPFIPS